MLIDDGIWDGYKYVTDDVIIDGLCKEHEWNMLMCICTGNDGNMINNSECIAQR